MLSIILLIIPLLGVFFVCIDVFNNNKTIKIIGLLTSVLNMIFSLGIFIIFDFSLNEFQFVQNHFELKGYNIYLGMDGLSIYFVLLTTIIMPISILSNWFSINKDVKWYITIILLLESLLLAVFIVLDVFLFYISFESILPPLFILIGLFGSSNKVRASFYLFLYTLLGSLFLLLSILSIYSIMGTTDYHALFKTNFDYITQWYLFLGIFIAFAVKTPTIFLNTWLLKAHVESPLGGSIILAGIVLKLSLYGILRLILPIIPKASIDNTFIVYMIGVVTIIYASFSTLRTIDVKELIAYSSVSHAAVYLIGVFSNTIQGIEGGILLGIAHGFVSSGLFICTGGILYDRSSTRLITYYRGITQIMPLFSLLFFVLCLSNAGTPLSLNFLGEFLSLYGTFERLPILGMLASTSIVFSAAYTIYMYNRIAFGGKLSKYLKTNIPDLNKREFILLISLAIFTVLFGIYPSPILDGLHFSTSTLLYNNTPLIFQSSFFIFSFKSWNKRKVIEKVLVTIISCIILYKWHTIIICVAVLLFTFFTKDLIKYYKLNRCSIKLNYNNYKKKYLNWEFIKLNYNNYRNKYLNWGFIRYKFILLYYHIYIIIYIDNKRRKLLDIISLTWLVISFTLIVFNFLFYLYFNYININFNIIKDLWESFIYASKWWNTVMNSDNSNQGPGSGGPDPGSGGPDPGGSGPNNDPGDRDNRRVREVMVNPYSCPRLDITQPLPDYRNLTSAQRHVVDAVFRKVITRHNNGQWVGKAPSRAVTGLANNHLDWFRWIIKDRNPDRFEQLWNRIGHNNYLARRGITLDGSEVDTIRNYINR